MSKLERDIYSRLFEFYDYRYDIFALMMERSLKLLNPDIGGFGMIVPSVLMNSESFTKLREYILSQFWFTNLVYFGDGTFEEAVVPTMISVLRRPKPNRELAIVETIYQIQDFQEGDYQSAPIRQMAFSESWNSTFNINLTLPIEELFQKIRRRSIQVGEISRTNRGIITGNDSKFLSFEKQSQQWKPVVRGQDSDRYIATHSGEYVFYAGRDVLHDPSNEKNFLADEKLFVRRIGDRLICSYDKSRLYCLDTLYTVVLEYSKLNLLYLLTVLNSNLLSELYRLMIPIKGRTFPEVRIYDFNRLPIRRIFFTTSPNEREQQMTELKSFYESSDYDSILTRIDELLPKDADGNFLAFARSISVKDSIAKGYVTRQDAEKSALKEDAPSGYDESGDSLEKSDVVHDFLAFLAEEMVEMNKYKREQIKRFWTDLEGVADADTFAKLQKGKQEKSLARKKPLRQFVNPVSASNRRLEDALEWTEEAFKEFIKTLAGRILSLSVLLDVYDKYASVVQTLAQRIQATDELIDGIVYRLYGLTAEEIAVVEREN